MGKKMGYPECIKQAFFITAFHNWREFSDSINRILAINIRGKQI